MSCRRCPHERVPPLYQRDGTPPTFTMIDCPLGCERKLQAVHLKRTLRRRALGVAYICPHCDQVDLVKVS